MPDVGDMVLAVKDHHLLQRTHQPGNNVNAQIAALTATIHSMGEQVAVRLGLSRSFHADDRGGVPPGCWLMADGFFSLTDPQP